jgi:hypothetical protein
VDALLAFAHGTTASLLFPWCLAVDHACYIQLVMLVPRAQTRNDASQYQDVLSKEEGWRPTTASSQSSSLYSLFGALRTYA